MNNHSFYYYKCPEELGFLEINLDLVGKVKNCIFVDSEITGKVLPQEIKNALNDYFYEKKDLPGVLISKDIEGTQFQKSIWTVICKTDFGETITYTHMAEMVGNSSAVRAAGTACGKNPIALFIPCHRVVRKQGEDYGYAWGTERKKWLLEFEKII